MIKVTVASGDISKVAADALITAINPGGFWAGGIDGVISRCAGNSFHEQAARRLPLKHLDTVFAKGGPHNRGAFSNVVFVIDEVKGRLKDVVLSALKTADQEGCAKVSMPTVRMGVMLGVVEKSKEEALFEMTAAVREFENSGPKHVKEIAFVVYEDPQSEKLLGDLIASERQ